MSEEKKEKPSEPVDDSDITIYDEKSGGLSTQKSKKFLAVYIIGLFSVALVLIMLSFLTQVRADKQMDALGNKLSEQTHAASGAKEKAEQLQTMIDEQKAKLEEAQKKITDLETSQAELQTQYNDQTESFLNKEKSAGALDLLWQLEKNYRTKKYTLAREIIASFEENYQGVLTGKSLEEYTKIKSALD